MYVRSQLLKALLPLAIVSQTLALPTMSYVGCFSASDGLTEYGTFNYQSSGNCQKDCVGNGNQAVLGLTNANDCWCGSEMPPNSTQVSDSQCNSPCVGWPKEDCGANGFWTVWLTGTSTDVQNAEGSSSGSSATTAQSSAAAQTTASAAVQTTVAGTTTNSQPSVITSIAPGKTVVVTESPVAEQSSTSSSSASPISQKKSGGTNTTAVVVGIVVGIVVLCALAGAAFFFIRHRRRQQADGEYKQNQVQSFMANGKPMIPANKRNPQTPNSSDPEAMAQRRMSDGSIADNEDYSRRILKVTNPDDR